MAEDENENRSTKKSTSGKKSSARGSTSTRKSASGGESGGRSRDGAPRAAARKKKLSASQIASAAARQLLELTGREAEGVTGLERTEDGWRVRVEVLEMRRIPETTDVLALYEVEVDDDGDMTGYQRVRRYGRGVPGED